MEEMAKAESHRVQIVGGLLLAALACILLWTARTHALDVDQDGIAYMRIAEYWAAGDFRLAITGYWGPLLSWATAAVLRAGVPLPLAGHLAAAAGGVLFVGASLLALRRLGLSPRQALVATALTALATVSWATESVTPDLLVSAFLLLGWAGLAGQDFLTSTRSQVLTGVALGIAYLAKAVALPVGVLSIAVAALLHTVLGERIGRVLRACSISATLLAAIAAPWILVLSLHYGKPTFSTSGPINHAIVGPSAPPDAIEHPYRMAIAAPDRGRVTSWEEPSGMRYPLWSPFESAENLRHQFGLVRRNHAGIFGALVSMDLLSLGVVALPAAFLFHLPWRENLLRQRWRWSFALLLPLFAIYLPVFAKATRYFYAAFPLMVGVSLALVDGMIERRGTAPAGRFVGSLRFLPVALACVAFGVPAALDAGKTLVGGSSGVSRAAHRTASALTKSGHAQAGFVGGGDLGTRLAFFARQPWCGDLGYAAWTPQLVRERNEEISASPCRIIVAPRRRDLGEVIEVELGARSLDALLEEGGVSSDPTTLPFELFELPVRAR